MQTKKRCFPIVLTILALFFVTLGARLGMTAEAYPTREINVYIGLTAGGGLDTTGRVMCKAMERLLGVPMVVINKPGASTAIATAYVANSKPDGYTLLWNQSPFPLLKKLEEPSVDYSLDKLTLLGTSHKNYVFLAVNASSPWKTYEQFIDYAKKYPVRFGSLGTLSPDSCLLDYLATFAGFNKVIRVPYSGGPDSARALLSKEVDAIIQTDPAMNYAKSGDFRFLVVFGPGRNPAPIFPDIPAIVEKEKGFNHFFMTRTFLAGPSGLPGPIVEKLTKTFKEAATTGEVNTIFRNSNRFPDYLTPEESVELWKLEEKVYKPYAEQFKNAASK
jgi:tripartite-type tricarboxylate transporter receptor subunit TctC